ncbi:MAG: Bax inhibitor-1/YccA family protein [Candidatus Omnitrophica bacterium]|nr:Bax inhibitor-1/YccA family protein [Candidatus Omnitrophota bacterium]
MRTANPALGADTFLGVRGMAAGAAMSIQGTVNKTAVLLALLLVSSAWTWGQAFAGAPVQGFIGFGAIAGFVVALVTIFKKAWAPITAPLYAALEGLMLGGVSAMFEASFPGIAIQAVTLTFGVLAALLIAYTSRLIPVTANFRLGIAAATGGIMLVYLASFVLGFFGVSMPFLHDSGPIGIGVSLFIVVIAALNLVLDFDFIEQGARNSLPKYMEWYAAFGLLVTLVWLYLEIIRLLAKMRSRR